MPNIETVEELADTLADWIGIYGACKSDGESGCELDESNPTCCRMGFTDIMAKRIRESVRNDALIEQHQNRS